MKKFHLYFLFLFSLSLCASEAPLAKVGLISDTHVTRHADSVIPIQKACELFKKHKVDWIVNCGDVADVPNDQAYAHYRRAVKNVYPKNKPFEMTPLAWHDAIGYGSYHTVWEKAWPDFKRKLELEHGLYDVRKLAGYTFLLVPQIPDWALFEKMISDACKANPDKPVFLVDHFPAWNTVYRSKTWGNVRRRSILNKYPQIIQLCGHIHGNMRRESCIWQGEFTVVNIPHCRQAVEKKIPLNGQAVIMEIYPKKVVFRRFDVMNGQEYNPDDKWIVPLPFDPATAPYTARQRKKIPAPQFAAGTTISIQPNRRRFTRLSFNFAEAQGKYGTFLYQLILFRKNAGGEWESFSVQEQNGGAMHPPAERKNISLGLSAGFFESGKEYKIRITPVDFFGNRGKSLEKIFTAPEKQKTAVLFESRDPMKDCQFKQDLSGDKGFETSGGYYLYHGDNARLIFPADAWRTSSKKTKFRLTIDLRMIQPCPDQPWTLTLRDSKARRVARGRIYTPGEYAGLQRYVINFTSSLKNPEYSLLIREGRAGKIRFEYVKIERR